MPDLVVLQPCLSFVFCHHEMARTTWVEAVTYRLGFSFLALALSIQSQFNVGLGLQPF
jgi:hypothetical protein